LGYTKVPLLNSRIRSLAVKLDVVLVDIDSAFNGDLSLIGADGLHPNERGYALIADRFFQILEATLEVSGRAVTPPVHTTSTARHR
jgi:lysophospholipase L1-like esterase